MKELIEKIEKTSEADYLLDTCFLIYEFSKGNTKQLEEFCKKEKVAMVSFNLNELEHVLKKKPGPITRHMREFLKENIIKNYAIDVLPGEWEKEKRYVQKYDTDLLRIIPDTSDAIMAVAALKTGATILTRDRHHVFTSITENRGLKVSNKFPQGF